MMKSNSERNTRRPTSVSIGPNSYKHLLVERRGERVLFVRFNRPTVRNALNYSCVFELIRVLRTVAHDPTYSFVVLSGVGEVFSSGFDLRNALTNLNAVHKHSANPIEMKQKRMELSQESNFLLNSIIQAFIACPKIIVALVNGMCIGIGFALCGLCDIVYCTENAYFETPFTRLGLCPEAGSSFMFPRIFGRSKATEILTFGKRLTAEEALQYKFVTHIFKSHELETHFWPKILEYSLLPLESLEISKRLQMETIKEGFLKAVASELASLKEIRFGAAYSNALQKFVQQSKNKSKL